jgi:hypothetical protein
LDVAGDQSANDLTKHAFFQPRGIIVANALVYQALLKLDYYVVSATLHYVDALIHRWIGLLGIEAF